MQISTLKPGDRVTSHCARCNDITSHAIVVIVNEAIHKVECCHCKAVHKYKPSTPEGKAPRRVAANKSTAPKKPTAAALKASRDAEVLQHNWQYALNNTVNKPAPYSMEKAWQTSDIIDHPTFGQGIVTELAPPDKMHVLFRDGARLLKNGTKA